MAVADSMRPLLRALLGAEPPVRFEFWDGGVLGPSPAVGTVRVRSPDAIRRIAWAPGELGIGRAYVAGDLDVEGDLGAVLRELRRVAPPRLRFRPATTLAAIAAAARLGALRRPLPAPPEEARPRGRRHSKRRDEDAVRHHYDVGNDFYEIVLGPSMTYSCARFSFPEMTLGEAQASKHELICRKLALHERPGARLLDVGCGWGTMAIHAAAHHGAEVVGVTISPAQVELARRRVAAAGLEGKVDIRLRDYRDLGGEHFDAISSVGMFEHVGLGRTEEYFAVLRRLLPPHGRLLNHAISSAGGSQLSRRSFAYRYVFPDGEILDVADVVRAMERSGFEVRDVESLREHYATTLRHWVANLEAGWEEAVRLVGTARTRIWRLYLAAAALGFEDGHLSVHQVLGVVPGGDGGAAMPATRDGWVTGAGRPAPQPSSR